MLKRIREIQGIGTYADCKAAKAEFRKVSVIYGSNSYGKSTLCEIFRSLAENDSDLIETRKSIPSGTSPKVTLNFSTNGSPETSLSYANGLWQQKLSNDVKLAVFDSNFIARNLFTGLDVERKNKEALTDFVLGEQGVKRADTIALKRKQLSQKQSDLRSIERAFGGIKDIPSFVQKVVVETESALLSHLDQIQRALTEKKQQFQNVEKITARPSLLPLNFPVGAHTLAAKITGLSEVSLDTIHQEVRLRLDRHLAEHVAQPGLGREWIRAGLGMIKGETCPFCGQALEHDAKALYGVFQACFDDTYKKKLGELEHELKDALRQYRKYEPAEEAFLSKIMANAGSFTAYPELQGNEKYVELQKNAELAAIEVREVANKFTQVLQQTGRLLEEIIEKKRSAPHVAIPPIDLSMLYELELRLAEKVVGYTVHIGDANSIIVRFKAELASPQASKEIGQLDAQRKVIEEKLNRRRLDKSCSDYIATQTEIQSLTKDIKAEQDLLQAEQSEFLKALFEKINYFFKKFGSNDFNISTKQELDGRGHAPVISLDVKFKGKGIALAQLNKVFSESDRRALALSIFWAKLSSLDETEKAKTIVIMDDPITSFDENRISVTMLQIEAQIPAYCQVIFLTHYRKFVNHLMKDTGLSGLANLLILSRGVNGTQIEIEDHEHFLHSDHHKKYLKIIGFIDGSHDQEIDQDLRVFLESEVQDRYRDAIYRHSLSKQQFGDLISSLKDGGVIEPVVANKLDQFRKVLNGPHHKWTDRTKEDWASVAQDVLDFVYADL